LLSRIFWSCAWVVTGVRTLSIFSLHAQTSFVCLFVCLFVLQYQGLNSGPTPALFVIGIFKIGAGLEPRSSWSLPPE
jgi:hypothetical protein